MSAEAESNDKCPLCLSVMDLTDKQLKPCKCGYEVNIYGLSTSLICLYCWHRIMEMDQKDESGGRCPGCRSVYNKDRILETSARNQMHVLYLQNSVLKELCAHKSNYQKEQAKSHKQTSAKIQLGQSEPKDPNNVRVIQRKLVYIVGMPTEFASEKLLRQKNFLGQYGKIENIIIDNVGANQHIPDSGRVYVTFAREEEAVQCIEAVNGYILDGRPLKATFGVTRYCHIWLSNRVCFKTNCSYVHHQASAEDICTKDDVSVVCARLQHLMGMDTKGPQHRSGHTLPPPGNCSSRTTTCSGISKDICMNDERLLPNGANKNTSLLPATTPRDLSLSSSSPPSTANVVLHQGNDHESTHNNQQNLSDPKSQKYIPPGGRNRSSTTSEKNMQHSCIPTEGTSLQSSTNTNMSLVSLGSKLHVNEQLDSNDDKSEASSQLGNGTSNSRQTTSVENGTSDTPQQKPQYSNVVSQGQVATPRRFTVLGRPKATGQIGNGTSSSTKLALVKNEHSNCITIPRSHLVSQRLEQPSHQASATVKSHAGAEKKNGCADISEKLVPGNHKQLSESTASHGSSAVQSNRPVPSNLSTSDAKSQATAGLNNLSYLNRRLAPQNQSQLVNQQDAPVSKTVIARTSLCHSTLNNQVPSADGKRQNLAQGGHEGLYSRGMVRSGAIVSSHCSDSTLLSRRVTVSAVSSTDVAAPDRKERKRQVCPPGFEKPHHSSDSDMFGYVSFPACSGLCSASDALVQDSCGITDQQDPPSWATDCLKDDDVTKNLNMRTSSRLGSTDTNQRHETTFFSGWSNHPRLSPYPSGLLHPHHKPEYWDGTTGSYMSTGGYDAFCQGTTSGMRGGMAGTLLQQPTVPSPHADSGINCPQIDISYPMYTLF
ncbi:CCR4-NOT transcription complex subunit 4 [Dichanthelium oligosanthes]|uniref:CCR4-NOT transcription complex subunit 4 n=1 Tax=Dichanthelium oligosanthes TaxID=888268 RepID=A0A1E5WKS2_9POAL|nr:CCR4-NOT transcription complex subunit 4 [Dichanthelium oligosanthes]